MKDVKRDRKCPAVMALLTTTLCISFITQVLLAEAELYSLWAKNISEIPTHRYICTLLQCINEEIKHMY